MTQFDLYEVDGKTLFLNVIRNEGKEVWVIFPCVPLIADFLFMIRFSIPHKSKFYPENSILTVSAFELNKIRSDKG